MIKLSIENDDLIISLPDQLTAFYLFHTLPITVKRTSV